MRASLAPYREVDPYLCDIVSATHEACKNAVVHNPECDEPVDVVCEVLADSVVVEVRDRGRGFDCSKFLPVAPPDPEAVAGRGMFLIHALMDAVETRSGSRGTCVVMQKLLEAT